MIKKNGISKEANLQMTCGSCIHHTSSALYEKPCSELGVLDYALAPKCFKPNVHALVQHTGPEFLNLLGRTASELEPEIVKLLAYTLSNAAQLQDQGFMFGQPVYISLGRDYIAHYFKAFMVSCTEDGIVTVSAKFNQAEASTTIVVHRDDVLTKSQWKKHLLKLANSGRFHIPEEHKPKYKKALPEILKFDGSLDLDLEVIQKTIAAEGLYEPPTIDMAPDDIIERHRKVKEAEGQKTGKGRKKIKPKLPGFDIQLKLQDGVQVFEIGDDKNEEVKETADE